MWETLIWLVPVAVVVAGLRRPEGGLLVLAAMLPLFGSPPGGPYLAALDVAALAAVATAWRAGRERPAGAGSPAHAGLDLPVLALLTVSFASLFPSLYHPPAWSPRVLVDLLRTLPGVESWSPLYVWRAFLNLLIGCLLFLAVRRAFAGRSPRPLALALAAGLAPLLLLGLAEHLGWIALDAYRPIGDASYEGRLHSLFFHSGWLAEYLVLAVPFAVAGLVLIGGRWTVAGLALAGAHLVALLFTQQRGSWYATLAQLGALAVVAGRSLLSDRRQLLRVAIAVLILALLGIGVLGLRADLRQPLVERFAEAGHVGGRVFVWLASVEMARERPLLGWGVGAFAPVYRALRMDEVAGDYDWLTAHNFYVMSWTERGLLGVAALALIAMVLLTSLGARATPGRPDDGDRAVWTAACWVGLVGFAVYGMGQYLFFVKAIEWLFWLLLGLAAAALRVERRRWSDRASRMLIAAALLAVPWRLATAERLATHGDRAFGFHGVEGVGERRLEWTAARAARRLEWSGEVLVLRIANGHPRPEEHRVEIGVRIDGTELVRHQLAGGWEELRIPVGPPRAPTLLLELEVHPTFRPFSDYREYPELDPSRDIRELGVAVGPVRWERTLESADALPGPPP